MCPLSMTRRLSAATWRWPRPLPIGALEMTPRRIGTNVILSRSRSRRYQPKTHHDRRPVPPPRRARALAGRCAAQLEDDVVIGPVSSRRQPVPCRHRGGRRRTPGPHDVTERGRDTGDEPHPRHGATSPTPVTSLKNTGDPSPTSPARPIASRLTSPGGHLQSRRRTRRHRARRLPDRRPSPATPVGSRALAARHRPRSRPTLLARPGRRAPSHAPRPGPRLRQRPGRARPPNDGRIATEQIRPIDLLDSGAEGFTENIDGVMMNLTVTDTLGYRLPHGVLGRHQR